MSDIIEGPRNKFLKWKEAFESKDLTVNIGKTKEMVSDNATKNILSKSKVDPCGASNLREKANSFWLYNVVSGSTVNVLEKMGKHSLQEILHAENVKEILEAVEQEVKLCDKVETVREFTYPVDRVSAVGGCEAVETARTRCGWHKLRECHCMVPFLLMLKEASRWEFNE